MFEFLAAGLPIVSTEAGARGIEPAAGDPVLVRPKTRMAKAVRELAESPEDRIGLAAAARGLVETRYAFERISPVLGRLLARHAVGQSGKKPLFSVIIPTLDRPRHLTRLMERLAAQTFGDFEVVVVDQTAEAWTGRGAFPTLDLSYLQHPVKGAVRAKNIGAFLARGSVLAFTDDDCLPAPDWLKNASVYFGDTGVVGVEGLIRSDRIGDPNFRSVNNENFRGMGFMTANFFIRQEDFNALGGFDLHFDDPHFREDTDLGWRALERGSIPYGFDVQVFHPAHRRENGRESFAERNRFFEKDALLLKKHPVRFRKLFLAETENKTPDYREHFLRGCRKYGIKPPDFFLSHLDKTTRTR
jgi:glycosyltransferase involved in cell wall biosynthesis